jgi:DNA-binding NarL/FixJ family response regulator
MGRRHGVLVVDDHPVFRRGLCAVLAGETWVRDVVEADCVRDAVRSAADETVDVVAMDVGLPDGDGIDATRRILATRPGLAVLMVTMTDDQDTVARALRAGARGYALKETDPETLVDALRTVAQGGVVLGPRVGPAVLDALRAAPATLPAPLDRLSARERQLLEQLTRGRSNAQIGRALGISEKTVRNQLSTVFTKLEVGDRVSAALLARDLGLSG